MPAFLRWLNDITVEDRPLVGGKAAVLGTLLRADHSVPDGFCITAVAFAYFKSQGCFPPGLLREIRHAYRALAPDGARVAVRSSGTVEDSSAASFAGQYETCLNIGNEDDLVGAILQCWEAADSARVQHYREKQQIKEEAVLPLLIQRMIPAQVSGVLFTVDPLSGVRETIIEAVSGLGEDLMSGRITPDRYRVIHDGEVRAEPANEQSLLASAQCRRLADLGQGVEAILGVPQDIEWALYEDQFYLLQARPVTSYPLTSIAASAVWTRANIGEVLPGVVTPLTWSVFRRGLLNRPLSFVDGPDGHGRGDTTDEGVRLIAGRAYLRLDKVLDTFCGLPGVGPEVMRRVLGVDIPKHTSISLDESTTFSPFVVFTWAKQWCKQGMFVLDALAGVPFLRWQVDRFGPLIPLNLQTLPCQVEELDDGLLKQHIEQLLNWVARCFQLHIRCTAYTIGVFGLLSTLLRRWLPAQADGLLPALLIGREDLQTAAQGLSLWRLAEQARRTPALEALLMRELSWPAMSLLAEELAVTEGGREFLAGLDAFLSSNGARAVGEFELRTPRWREDPGFVLVVLRGYLRDRRQGGLDYELDRRQRLQKDALAEAEVHLRSWQRVVFRRLLYSYSICVTLRENMKYYLMEGYYVLRRLFLALGERLCVQGVIGMADDIFFLTASEAIALACGDRVPAEAMHRTVQKRRDSHAIWEREGAPLFSPWVIDSHSTPVGPHTEVSSHAVLEGIACSPGRAQGRARVLRDVSLAGTFQSGEVLVAPSTDPGWTPLFLTAAAVVTEIGGFLSHGATVAREYGIPAVVSVRAACATIRTGDLVTVDGDAGVVLVHQGATAR